MFEMDVLRRSRSSYNPTVSFRVYAIRVLNKLADVIVKSPVV